MNTNHQSTTEAAAFLRTLQVGDAVIVTQDGRDYSMTVSRAYQRADGAYGDPNGGNVVTTLGPGRWSTTVSAGRVADGYVSIRRASDELMVEPDAAEVEADDCDVCNQLPCDECGADAGQPCAWSCTARPEVRDAPLNVRATVRRPDGDTFVIFAGQVPAWLWEDERTRELWKREHRGHTLRNANVDPKARGYRVTFDAWDPAEAPIV